MMFYAAFDKPRLDFICNHDAILRLTIKEGHYNTEFTKGAINPANAYVILVTVSQLSADSQH